MLLDILAVGSTGYAAVSAARGLLMYRRFLNEKGTLEEITEPIKGVELYTPTKHVNPPVYMTLGNSHVSVPIGGGDVSTDYKRAHSSFIGDKTGRQWTNYWAPNLRGHEFYINSAEQLISTAEQYKIDLQTFPAMLPMKAHAHKWHSPVWADGHSGRISTSRAEVARAAAFARRYPLSMTAAVVGGVTLAIAVAVWRENRRYRPVPKLST